MVLSAFLRLDAGAFTTPLGTAVEGVKAAVRVLGDLGEKINQAFETGAALYDLQQQTGELPGTLMVLKQAFQDTGVGAESVGRTLAIMRKSLAGISETGEPTGKMFQQLGLDINAIKNMSAIDQLKTIGAAITTLKTPAEQTTAAMGIFGRSGALMMPLLKEMGHIDLAAASLGGMPALMNKNAAAFEAVSDRIGHIKIKGQGLWAGIAEGLLPLADKMSTLFDGIDLTGLGQRFGAAIGTIIQMIGVAADYWHTVFGVAIDWWHDKTVVALNYWKTELPKIGKLLWDVLAWPLEMLGSALGFVVQQVMELLGKIPKVGKMLGLDGFKAQSWDETHKQFKSDMDSNAAALAGKVGDVLGSAAEAVADGWNNAAAAYQARLAGVQTAAAGKSAPGTNSLIATKDAKSLKDIPTDALARIGGFLGGKNSLRTESLAERTAKATERMANFLERDRSVIAGWSR